MPRLSDPSDSNTSRCFSLSLQSSVKWSQDRINDGCWFHPGLNEMSWDAHSLEETGWATQALFLNGKIAEGGEKNKLSNRHTHTHGRLSGAKQRPLTHTDWVYWCSNKKDVIIIFWTIRISVTKSCCFVCFFNRRIRIIKRPCAHSWTGSAHLQLQLLSKGALFSFFLPRRKLS